MKHATVPPANSDKPAKKKTRPLSTALQTMARIERIMADVPDAIRTVVWQWFNEVYSPKPAGVQKDEVPIV